LSEASIRQLVFKALKKNPLLTAKSLAKILDLDYKVYKKYLWALKSTWKTNYRLGLGSKAQIKPSFHNARGWVYVDRLNLDRALALEGGWIRSESKNRPLIWKDPKKLGRMEWFETGRVNLFIRSPALKGRVYQLFCNGFSYYVQLITSMQVLSVVLESIRLKAAHAVFDVGEKLPYMVVDLFKGSNGIVFKSGDKTHPTAFEFHFCYPDWGEKNEQLLSQVQDLLKPKAPKKLDSGDPWYVS
jgi:hypothetical protein